jgi:hypothetical protein
LNRFAVLICAVCFASFGLAQSTFFPLRDVKPGLKGVGRTVFHGNQIEEFQVEILGVLENSSPKQSIILARLTGGPLAQVGVMQGMSGSPVYIDGKLLGAVALGFPFSKEAITGIQPIEQMIHNTAPSLPEQRASKSYAELAATWEGRFRPNTLPTAPGNQQELRAISTPLALGGFTESTLQTFSTALRSFGFEPQSGLGSGSPTTQRYTGTVQPGSMISVELMSGDLNVSADGTVTYVDGKKVYAFGHRFLANGSTDLPFARAEVLTLLANVNSSFKISAARELVGSITSDMSTAVAGEIGRPAQLVPLHIDVHDRLRNHTYDIKLVNDRLFTPFLAQMALFSAIDATERTAGAGTLAVHGTIEFQGATPPLEFENVFAADSNAALAGTFNLVVPLAFSQQAGFADLQVKKMSFRFDASEEKKQVEVQDVWLSKSDARPGDTVDVAFRLAGGNGKEILKAAQYKVPIGAPIGRLFFTVSDANTLNFSELAGLSPSAAHSAPQLVGLLNQLRANNKAYIRVWRQEPSFSLPGADISDPPPSAALVLARTSSAISSGGTLLLSRGAQIAEIPIALGDYAVTGSKTVQLDIKE